MRSDEWTAGIVADWIASVVAAIFTWGLLAVAAATALAWVYWLGYRRGRFLRRRDVVRAAYEQAVAETVPILVPSQRTGER